MGADPDWEPKAHFSLRVFSGWWWGLSPTRMGWKHEALSVLLPTLPIGGRAKGVSSSMGLGDSPHNGEGPSCPWPALREVVCTPVLRRTGSPTLLHVALG